MTEGFDVSDPPVKRVPVRPFKAGPTNSIPPAKGTCPGCGRRRTVKAVETRGVLPQSGTGPLLELAPLIAEHRVGSATCPGGVPTETTYHRPPNVADWTREHGPDAAVRK